MMLIFVVSVPFGLLEERELDLELLERLFEVFGRAPDFEGEGLGLDLDAPAGLEVSMFSASFLEDMLLLLLLLLVVVMSVMSGSDEMIVLCTIFVSSSSKIMGAGRPSSRSSPS